MKTLSEIGELIQLETLKGYYGLAKEENIKLKNKLDLAIQTLEVIQKRMEESPYKDMPRVTATSVQIRSVLMELER